MLQGKVQFSIATLLLLTAIVALLVRLNGTRSNARTTMGTSDLENRLVVDTGVRNNKLLFVAITGDPKDSPVSTNSIATSHSSKSRNWHVLNYPDGTEQMLPKPNVQLFQYIDGNWSESSGDVTPLEYDEFCASDPERFTIQSLLEFVDNKRNAR